MIIIGCQVLGETINVEFYAEEVPILEINKAEFETWVDENYLRETLEHKFDGEYRSKNVKLTFEEYYEQDRLHRDLENFISENL